MSALDLTPNERARMEAAHGKLWHGALNPGQPPVTICTGCGMDWPCPGRRLLDYRQLTVWQRITRFFSQRIQLSP